MITEDRVTFEIAKLLRDKGFPQNTFEIDCNVCYKYNGNLCNNAKSMSGVDREISYMAPTIQMAMKWLRKKHKIGIFPRQYHVFKERALSDDFEYGVEILKLGSDMPLNPSRENMPDKKRFFIFKSYEEAVEEAIKYSLENLI